MQCPSCNTELPKKAKICPKCGTAVGKPKGNIKLMAIIGLIIMLIASLLPLVQSGEKIKEGVYPIAYAFSYMNISMPVLWYLFIACIVVGIILVVARKEFFSIITTVIATVLTVVSVFAVQFTLVNGKVAGGGLKYVNVNLTDILSNGYNGNSYHIGCGFVVLAIGIVIAVAGCFIDIMKYFKKDINVDSKYMTNSINRKVWSKIYYHRWFYVMFLPVLIMILLFNYWPMLGCRYAFTKYIIRSPYYVGLLHFNTMFTNDVFFWDAFRNTLLLSIVKLILNTGAAVIISLLLNEITNLAFKKTVQTIVYLPHFMSWVVVASVFKMILDPNPTGVVNSLLLKANLVNEPIYFLGDSKYWRGTFYVMNVWKDTGWGTILFLATLSGISPDLYEAAEIDGAGKLQKIRYIDIPSILPTAVVLLIMNSGRIMSVGFEKVLLMQNPMNISASEIISTYVYKIGLIGMEYSYSAAIGLFNSVINLVLILVVNGVAKRAGNISLL